MLFVALALPALAAQHTRYKIVGIDTFGGPTSRCDNNGSAHGLEQHTNTMMIEPVGNRFLAESNHLLRNFCIIFHACTNS